MRHAERCFAGGWLSGKFTRSQNAPPEGTRVHYSTTTGYGKTGTQSHPDWDQFAGNEKVSSKEHNVNKYHGSLNNLWQSAISLKPQKIIKHQACKMIDDKNSLLSTICFQYLYTACHVLRVPKPHLLFNLYTGLAFVRCDEDNSSES